MMERNRVSPCLLPYLVGFLVLALFPVRIGAAELRGDVLVDSEIVMVEQGGHAYQAYRMTIATKNGSTTVTIIKDGNKVEGTMSSYTCLALWQYLLSKGIEYMTDTKPPEEPPGQAAFTLTFRVGGTSHSFSVSAVDFLPDSRYRDVVRAILEVPDHYMQRGG